MIYIYIEYLHTQYFYFWKLCFVKVGNQPFFWLKRRIVLADFQRGFCHGIDPLFLVRFRKRWMGTRQQSDWWKNDKGAQGYWSFCDGGLCITDEPSKFGVFFFLLPKMVVSWNRATPSSHPLEWDFPWHHPSIWRLPIYGNPQNEVEQTNMIQQ